MKSKLKTIFRLLVISSFCAGFVLLSASVYVYTHSPTDNKQPADAIIVLGNRIFVDGKFNDCLESSINHAVTLQKSGFAQTIIVTGGFNRDDQLVESLEMQKKAIELGANAKHILVEPKALTTYENLVFSQELMFKNNLHSAIIVTEPYHSPRADLIAQKLNLDHSVSVDPKNPCYAKNSLRSLHYLLRESAAIIKYKLTGKI